MSSALICLYMRVMYTHPQSLSHTTSPTSKSAGSRTRRRRASAERLCMPRQRPKVRLKRKRRRDYDEEAYPPILPYSFLYYIYMFRQIGGCVALDCFWAKFGNARNVEILWSARASCRCRYAKVKGIPRIVSNTYKSEHTNTTST